MNIDNEYEPSMLPKLPYNLQVIEPEVLVMVMRIDELLEKNEPMAAYDYIKGKIENGRVTLRLLTAVLELVIEQCENILELDRFQLIAQCDVLRDKFKAAGGERITHTSYFIKIFKVARTYFTYMIRPGAHDSVVQLIPRQFWNAKVEDLLEDIDESAGIGDCFE